MDARLATGRLVAGRYRLVREIGAGGMGAVWHAVNETTNRDFAIKFLKPDAAKTALGLRRFLTEAKICGSLQHPNVVEVFDVGTLAGDGDPASEAGAGEPFLVMELLRGEPLDVVLSREKRLSVSCALGIARAVVDVLATAHAAGVVHRDLKPANLFLQRLRDGGVRPKVLDFGVSKLEMPNASEHTSVGSVVGSPAYMSPEQAGGQSDVDGRADQWAVGAILHRCLSGRLPFPVTNYNATMLAIATTPAPPLVERAPGVPADVCALVDRCLSRSRDERFADATALLLALDALVARHGGGAEELAALVRTPAEPTPPRPLLAVATEGAGAIDETTADLPAEGSERSERNERGERGERGEAADTRVTSSLAVPSPPPARRRRTAVTLLLAASACALLAAWLWTRSRPRVAATAPENEPTSASSTSARPSGALATSASVASLPPTGSTLAAPSASHGPSPVHKPTPNGKPKPTKGKPSSHEGIDDPGL